MAQLNITLNQDEILQLLSADREDAFRTLYLRLENSCRDSIQVHLFPKKYCNLGEKLYFPPIFL